MKALILENFEKYFFNNLGKIILFLKGILIIYLAYILIPTFDIKNIHLDYTFAIFVLVGFIAELIDGSAGMAYGTSASTLLLNVGVPPKVATACIHTSEVFTTGVSGLMHLRLDNVNKKLFFRLIFSGVIGAVIGAYLISNLFNGKILRPYISMYLLILGLIMLYKGIFKKFIDTENFRWVKSIAFIGGFLDSIGGGGWGPIVTSNLIYQGGTPKNTIGTINTVEFFVTFFSTGVFLFFIQIENWYLVFALIIGGVLGAPLGAIISKILPRKTMVIAVSILIIITSTLTIIKSFF